VRVVDWRLEHAIYDVSLHHHWVGSLFHGIEQASIPVMVVITGLLWFFSRPGGDRKWKLACACAYLSAAIAYAVAFVIHHVYDRARPYEAHAIRHPWSSSTDASFPSDHTSLSFAIAFAVLAFDTVAGAVFLVVAAIIGVGRLFIGAHYPGDVLMGVLVGAVVAFVVVRWLRPFAARVAGWVERATDPLVSRIAR
jgi:membrane-associated phospholipid phosphatase